ncbi:MAG: hypothetical protein RLZZ308_444 [Candidatus Parcubacteria bacterium]|jgi:hypothetical protein
MQDIRKPYTRSRSNEDLQARLERFQDTYHRTSYDDDSSDAPVRIPIKRNQMSMRDMDVHYRHQSQNGNEDDFDYSSPRKESIYPERRPKYPRKISLRSASSLLIGVLLLVGTVLYTYVFDSATVTIIPKTSNVTDFKKVVTAVKGEAQGEEIPFVEEMTTLSKSKTLQKSESRKVEAKASGKVFIYNNYDDNPQKLIKNTRFESSEGKIYRIADSVVVPGKNGDTPGSVEVVLYADSTGADYNISSTSFTIPGFKNSPRYSAFYAKTKTAITGGVSGTMALASLSDVNAAKDSLAIELEKEIKKNMSALSKEGYIPLISAIEIVYSDNEDDILRGESDEYKVTATGHLMFIETSKLAEVIASNATITDYKKEPVRVDNLEAVTFTRRSSDSLVNATSLPLLIEGAPRIIWETDKDTLITSLLGKDRSLFKTIAKDVTSAGNIEVSFSPIWVSTFPSTASKIHIKESLPAKR